MSHFGQVKVDTIIAGILDLDTQPSEVSNIVTALKPATEQALPRLKTAAASASVAQNWQTKTRLATVAMYLGDTSLAAEMLQAVPDTSPSQERPWDPNQRTRFIAELPNWSGDVELLAEMLRETSDPDLRSGISLAIGDIARPGAEAYKLPGIDDEHPVQQVSWKMRSCSATG